MHINLDDELDALQVIVGYPQTKPLTSEEKDLIWKFRFYLSTQKKVSNVTSLSLFSVISFQHSFQP